MHFQSEGSVAIKVKDGEAAWQCSRAGPAWDSQRTSSRPAYLPHPPPSSPLVPATDLLPV